MLKLCILVAAYQSVPLLAFKQQKVSVLSYSKTTSCLLRAMTHGVKKENLPSKMCVTCNRPFTWRKKWERCWDEVSTCSKGCNAKRRALAQKEGRDLPDDVISDDEDDFKKVDSKKGGAHVKVTHGSLSIAGLQNMSILNDDEKYGTKRADLADEENDEENDIENGRPGKKLSRKKLLKLKMKEVDAELLAFESINGANKLDATILNDDIDKADEEKNIEADEEENEKENNEIKTESDKPEKKLSRKKLQKLKLKEEALADSSSKDKKDGPTERTKTCAVCNGEDILLFRCQWDTSKQWRFVCT